jgi:hypothetical protein
MIARYATTAEVVQVLTAMMRESRDGADARARTAGRVYSVRSHRRERAYAANVAARWQG